MWQAMGWVCNERPNAVINTLKNVYRWRCTRWWQSTHARKMKEDPGNHTRWKQKWRWHKRGNVWVRIATDWVGKEDWMKIKENVQDKICNFRAGQCQTVYLTQERERRKGWEENQQKDTEGLGTRGHNHPHTKKDRLYNYVERVKWQVGGQMVNVLWDTSTEEKWAKFKKKIFALMVEKKDCQSYD